MRQLVITAFVMIGLYDMAHAQVYSNDHNYVSERIYAYVNKHYDNVQYYDSGGRMEQMILVNHTPSGASLVTHFNYNTLDNPIGHINPMPISGNGTYSYSHLPESPEDNPYSDSDCNVPSTYIEYDWRPDQRIIYSTRAGADGYQWQEYATNGKACPIFRFIAGTDAVIKSGTYPDGEIAVSTACDEDKHKSMSFTDKRGRCIMTRRINGDENLDTYYVYDDYNNLCYVLTPECTAAFNYRQSDTDDILKNYAYIYKYDNVNRCIYMKRPSSEPVYYVYDKSGQLIFCQDGNLRQQGLWCFTIPDRIGRTAISGICSNSISYLNPESISSAIIRAEKAYGSEKNLGYVISGVALDSSEVLSASYYDDYSFMDISSYSSLRNISPKTGMSRGLLTGTYNAVLGQGINGYKITSIYYDAMSRPNRTISMTDKGISMTVTAEYDLAGELCSRKFSYGGNIEATIKIEESCSYDNGGRIVSETSIVNDMAKASVRYQYDEVDRLRKILFGEGTGAVITDYRYNYASELTAKTSPVLSYIISYNKPQMPGSKGKNNGNVSEVSWLRGINGKRHSYSFYYDDIDRLADARHWIDGEESSDHLERSIRYDKNSNIRGLSRYYDSNSDSLDYKYSGEQMTSLSVNGIQHDYEYDNNGNMIYDGRNCFDIKYNINNQISTISRLGRTLVSYEYLADGTKISAEGPDKNGLYYLGPATFLKSGNSYKVESIAFSAGRFTISGHEIIPQYFMTDHVGSVRDVVSISQPMADSTSVASIIEENDYFPFGMRWIEQHSSENRFHYNGQEEQSGFGVSYLDYGIRMYDPYMGRWNASDPIPDYSFGSYSFCNANPLNKVDLLGLSTYYVDGTAHIINDGDDKFEMNVTQKEFDKLQKAFDKNSATNIRYGHLRNGLSKKHGYTTHETETSYDPGSIDGAVVCYHSGKESYLDYQQNGNWASVSSILSFAVTVPGNKTVTDRINVGSNNTWYFRKILTEKIFNGNQHVKVQKAKVKYAKGIGISQILSKADMVYRLYNTCKYEGTMGINTQLLLVVLAGEAVGSESGQLMLTSLGIKIGGAAGGPVGAVVGGAILGGIGNYLGSKIMDSVIL